MNKIEKQTFEIEGMSCAVCAGVIERTLNKLEGVNSALVNYASHAAVIEFEPAVIPPEKLQSAVQSAGYDLLLEEKPAEEKSPAGFPPKIIVSIILAAVLMLFMFLPAFPGNGLCAVGALFTACFFGPAGAFLSEHSNRPGTGRQAWTPLWRWAPARLFVQFVSYVFCRIC